MYRSCRNGVATLKHADYGRSHVISSVLAPLFGDKKALGSHAGAGEAITPRHGNQEKRDQLTREMRYRHSTGPASIVSTR